DGRVNVLFSYFVRISIGIEIDEWTLEEYGHLKVDLEAHLQEKRLSLPPDNIFLFHGDSTDYLLHEKIKKDTGISFNDIDLFYTYLTMYDEYAELIASQAKKDSVFMVYGLEKILPTLNGFRLLTPKRSIENILALYQKR
ncbi:MAG: hypothetical protein SV375_03385, partial [Thermodesulfobacteriota bacterium]|nr:hypothetical protein [Thermodesulfobacteriota bacterium]